MNPKQSQAEYQARINRVVDYISDHIDDPLPLRTLARVACFSECHFHRIFGLVMGETLNDFITRLRLEKAIYLMRHSPGLNLTKIALESGFQTSANFSRVFRKRLGVAPRDFDLKAYWEDRKIGKDQRFEGSYYWKELPPGAFESEFEVEVKRLAGMHLAYLRVFNSYGEGRVAKAFEEMGRWAAERGLLGGDAQFIGMSQDDPEITPAAKCRYDVCLTVPRGLDVDGAIGTRRMPAATYGVLRCQGSDWGKIDRAWNHLFKGWLPRSGYQPTHAPAMEVYHRSPLEGWELFDFDACIPVKPL